MARSKAAQEREDRNKHVVEWTISIVGIFWGVWWAFFVNCILQSKASTLAVYSIEVPKWLTLMASVGIVFGFVRRVARWMWYVRTHSRRTQFGTVWDGLKPVLLWVVFLLGMVGLATLGFGLEEDQFFYGLALTALWPLSVLAQVFW